MAALVHALECSCSNAASSTNTLVTRRCCALFLMDGQFKVTSQPVDKPSSNKQGDCTAFWLMEKMLKGWRSSELPLFLAWMMALWSQRLQLLVKQCSSRPLVTLQEAGEDTWEDQ